MFVHFTTEKWKPNQPKIIKCSIQNNFSIFMAFQNAKKNVFHGFGKLVIWLWKSFGNILKGLFTHHEYLLSTPECSTVELLVKVFLCSLYLRHSRQWNSEDFFVNGGQILLLVNFYFTVFSFHSVGPSVILTCKYSVQANYICTCRITFARGVQKKLPY